MADGDVPPTSPGDAETPMPRPPSVAGGSFCATGGTARGGEQVSHTCMTADLATQRASDGTHVWVPGSLFVVAPRR